MIAPVLRTLTITLLLASPAQAGERLLIDLPERVSCNGGEVTIGDIARLIGGDATMRARINNLDIADRPGRDRPTIVTRKQVEFRLRLAGIPPEQFQLIGSDSVSLILQRRTITTEEVIAVAKGSLLKRLPWSSEEISVEMVAPVVAKLPEVAAGEEVSITAEPHSPSVGIGRSQMDVTLRIDGERRLTLPVIFEARPIQKVAVVLRPIAAGEPISESNVRVESRAVDPNRKYVLGDEAIGRKARKPIMIGHVLALDDIEQVLKPVEPVLVKIRQRVSMTVQLGSVLVTAAGESLQDGKLGQVIRVQNIDSKKIISARVTGSGTVEVELGGAP